MVGRLLLGIFAGMCLNLTTEGVRFFWCDSDLKHVEGDDLLPLSCKVNSTSTVRWTVVNETGATLHLGTCYGPDNCTNFYNSSGVQVVQMSSSTYVRFYKIASQFSGVLTCQETLTNGTALTDTCQLNVGRVGFHSTRHDIREKGSGSIFCFNSGYKNSTVAWSLTTNSGQTMDLGTCTDVFSCTKPLAPDIYAIRTVGYLSSVTFEKMERSNSGHLFCSYTYNGLKETENITLNVYEPPTITNCHADLHLSNWSTILSCDISHVFSSSGYYHFSVWEYCKVLTQSRLCYIGWDMLNDNLSYRDVLTPYIDSTDNKLYYRGRLTHSWPLSSTWGSYTSLTVQWHSDPFGKVYVHYPVNITRPSQPTHNCSELNYIPETGVVPCVCTADFLGSPAGRLVWLLGNITIATGDYGETQLPFPSGQVSRQHDGMKVTCQLDWVQPINTAFTCHVASFSQSQTETEKFNWTAVCVGVALGLVVITLVVLVVVIIVFYRHGRLSNATSQDDEDSLCYTSLKFSKATKNKRNGAQQGVSCPPAVYQGDGDKDYENTAMGGQGGHM